MKIKKINKKLALILVCMGVITSLLPLSVSAQSNIETNYLQSYNVSNINHKEITPYAPIIDWRYKVVDGKLYRRQYNYSTQEWIGVWELC